MTTTESLGRGNRSKSFSGSVRQRDLACIITGTEPRFGPLGPWYMFEAAHIFPLAYEQYWNDNKFYEWVRIPPATPSDGMINSVQNGILLRSDIHTIFDAYEVAINPDVRIAEFSSLRY